MGTAGDSEPHIPNYTRARVYTYAPENSQTSASSTPVYCKTMVPVFLNETVPGLVSKKCRESAGADEK